MSKLVVCLGYRLNADSSINTILENRLRDAVFFCEKNPNSTLILMGSYYYQDKQGQRKSEALAMKEYLLSQYSENLKNTEIKTEENSTSTVEQIYYLKQLINSNYKDLVIISSEFFGERVKLYTEYILGTTKGILFIESKVPEEVCEQFKVTETIKLVKAEEWLFTHHKGDAEVILKEQKVFEDKVQKGKMINPVS